MLNTTEAPKRQHRAVLIFIWLGLIAGCFPASSHAQSTTLTLTASDMIVWQPRGGEIHFTVAGAPASVPANIAACLSWAPPPKQPADDAKPPVLPQNCVALVVRRVAEVKDPPGVTFAVTVPRNFEDRTPDADSYLAGIVPAAYLYISAPATKLESRKVGITSLALAIIVTVLAVLGAGTMMYRFAKYLGVPGPEYNQTSTLSLAVRGFSVPLRLISSAKGWASLAQFQIMLWTFVIGAGAVYVMSLTGSLIPISTGTLALLGIAGGAAVLSEVKSNQQSQSAAPAPVLELRTVGQPLPTEILVSWLPPASGAAASSYIVQYEHPSAANQWRYVSSDLRTTSLRIVNLEPATAYRVRVIARNDAGNSNETIVPAPTAAATLPTPSVANLRTQITDGLVRLQWDCAAGARPADFVVQMRPTDSDDGWTQVDGTPDVTGTPAWLDVPQLKPATRYDFRLRLQSQADAWLSVPPCKIANRIRTPKWSDIVTDTDKPAEIDVTRVQMLFFTVISAFFVGLQIVDSGTIPEIDPTYVTLMGISNGVYVTAKFVRN